MIISKSLKFGIFTFILIIGGFLVLSYIGGDTPVGYEMIDSEILHFWNAHDDYYLNMTSGIQFSNYHNESWTHNIFCAGYKTAQWNYKCNDELPIELTAYSDNSTYVQINGTRVITIAERNIGIGINYRLEDDDTELNITVGLKHLSGENITTDLGFAWRVNQIKVNNDYENDVLNINDSIYSLNDTFSYKFENMTRQETRVYLNDTEYNETIKIPHYAIIDNNKFIKLRWNENLNYFVQANSWENADNDTITLVITTTGLNFGQTKKTSFYWRDPEVVATSTSEGDYEWGDAWKEQMFYDSNNDRWFVTFIDGGGDINISSAPINDITSWTSGGDILPGAYDYEDYDCAIDLSTGTTYLHCVVAAGTSDYAYYKRCLLNSTSPYVFCGSTETFIDYADLNDDVAHPNIVLDSDRCVLVVYDWEDDSLVSGEHQILLLKENATTTCGDGDFDTDDYATGFPITLQSSAGYDAMPIQGIRSYGDLDAQIFLFDTEDGYSDSVNLKTSYFNGTTNQAGPEVDLDPDVEYKITSWVSGDSLIQGENSFTFIMDDTTTDLDVFRVIGRNTTSLTSQVDTGIDVYYGIARSGMITAVVDTRSATDDLWVFAVDDDDPQDIYYAKSADDGLTWSQTLWQDEAGTDEVKFLTAVYDNETCNISVRWLDGASSPWSIKVDTINTGSCEEGVEDNFPVVTLSTPANATSSSTTDYNFTCNVTDDFNIANTTIYVWHDNGTLFNSTLNSSTGISLNYSFEIPTLIVDTYYWNCKAVDNASQSSWATNNFTLIVYNLNTRDVTQSLSLTDTLKRIGIFDRDETQPLSFSSVINRLNLIKRSTTQSITINNIINRILLSNRDSTQSISVSDVTSRRVIFDRDEIQSISFSDALNRILISNRNPIQILSFNDLLNRILISNRDSTQSLSFSDLATGSYIDIGTLFNRSVTQSLSVSDTISRILISNRDPTQSLSFNDVLNRILILKRSSIQILSFNDLLNRILISNRDSTQSITINNLATGSYIDIGNVFDRDVTQALSISDAISRIVIFNREPTQSLSISNIVSRTTKSFRSVNQIITFVFSLIASSGDATAPTITLNSPVNETNELDGIVSFTFTPDDDSAIDDCSLIYQGGTYTTSTSITKAVQNVIQVTGIVEGHSLYNDNLQWRIDCTDEYGNVGSSETRHLDTKRGDGSGFGLKNPRGIDLFYPKIWFKGSEQKVILKVYNILGEIYEPPIVKMDYLINGIVKKSFDINEKNEIEWVFEVKEETEIGSKLMKLIVEDEKILEEEMMFEVLEKQVIIYKDSDLIKKIMWIILIMLGLFVIILAIKIDRNARKKRKSI